MKLSRNCHNIKMSKYILIIKSLDYKPSNAINTSGITMEPKDIKIVPISIRRKKKPTSNTILYNSIINHGCPYCNQQELEWCYNQECSECLDDIHQHYYCNHCSKEHAIK